jgi:hypothetical protein
MTGATSLLLGLFCEEVCDSISAASYRASVSIIHDGLGLLLDLQRPLVYLPFGFRRSLVQAISGLGSLFLGSQMSRDMLPSGSRSRYLSPDTKKFFCKSVFHTKATPLWDRTIFGQVFGRGGMTVSGWWLRELRRTLATGLQRLGVRLEVTRGGVVAEGSICRS